jgi:hypothetical protein
VRRSAEADVAAIEDPAASSGESRALAALMQAALAEEHQSKEES